MKRTYLDTRYAFQIHRHIPRHLSQPSDIFPIQTRVMRAMRVIRERPHLAARLGIARGSLHLFDALSEITHIRVDSKEQCSVCQRQLTESRKLYSRVEAGTYWHPASMACCTRLLVFSRSARTYT